MAAVPVTLVEVVTIVPVVTVTPAVVTVAVLVAFVAELATPMLHAVVMLPPESSFTSQKSLPPAPNEFVVPTTPYPPSKVCLTEPVVSSPVPPYVFCYETVPVEVSFSTQKSKPPAPNDCIWPATMYPPSDVC